MDNIKLNTVISAIKACTGSELKGYRCSICPYVNRCNGMIQYAMLDDALALLKAQEPMLVKHTTSTIRCPKCNKQITSRGSIHNEIKYCWKCGQAVKWE